MAKPQTCCGGERHGKPEAKNILKATSPNSVLVRAIDSPSVSTVLYTDFPAAGKNSNLAAEDLARRAIQSVGKADEGKDGISYLINAIESGIETPLTQRYCDAILNQTDTDSLEGALDWAKNQHSPKESAII